MDLPFSPGYSGNPQLGKERFHKSQHFCMFSGLPMLAGLEKPGIGGEGLVGQKVTSRLSEYPKGKGSDLPSWVAFDKQALCFEAYFRETVSGPDGGTHRIRKCKIYFYLEDDTIKVVEPKCKNSCLYQGTFIRRQRIPLPPPKNDQFYNVFHFNINQEIVFYSRTFTITDCNLFTKNFLIKLGVQLNEPAMMPDDPYTNFRQQLDTNMKHVPQSDRHRALKQFLDNDGKILRFFCLWDDTENMYGDYRELILHYYLADDTIEVFEVIPPNSGRDYVPKFLSRSKLPKMGASSEEFYKDSDLTVGGEVNIWGRRLLITDCDEFTKEYYRSKYGIEDFTPVQYKVPPAPKPPKPVPPYNGFGSAEDSLSSCQGLLPRPPQKDFRKFMEKDRCGLNSNVLSFHAKMMTTDPVVREREFIISFYLSDDSMSVFERPQRNSGVLAGKFLKRQRVRKPGQNLFKSEPFEYFTAQDLYVGAAVCLNGVDFQLLDADDYTLKYMEQHAEEFPRANIDNILSKLRSIPEDKKTEIKKYLSLSDPTSTGFIPYESFRGLIMGLDCGLSEHEVLVLVRRFSEQNKPKVNLGLMLAVAQDFLKRKCVRNISGLLPTLMSYDKEKVGRLPTKDVRTICKVFTLPIPESLLDGILNNFADGDGIDYHAFVAGINWFEHPAPPVMPEDILRYGMNARIDDGESSVKNINYINLLKDILSFSSNHSDPELAALS